MQTYLISIKDFINTHTRDEVLANIPDWHKALKGKGISSASLEAILYTFLGHNEEMSASFHCTEGFVLPQQIRDQANNELIVTKEELRTTKESLKKKQAEVLKLKKQRKWIIITFAIVLCLVLSIIAICVL